MAAARDLALSEISAPAGFYLNNKIIFFAKGGGANSCASHAFSFHAGLFVFDAKNKNAQNRGLFLPLPGLSRRRIRRARNKHTEHIESLG